MLYRLSCLAIFSFSLTALAVPIQFTFSGPQGSVAINGGPNLDGVVIQLVLQGDTANLVRGGGIAGSDVYRGLTGTLTVSGLGQSISSVAVTSPVDVQIGFPAGIGTLANNAVGISVNTNLMATLSATIQTALPSWDRASAVGPLLGSNSTAGLGVPTLRLANGSTIKINNFDSVVPFGRSSFQATVAPSITTTVSAGAFGGFRAVAPGGWLEIFGKDLAGTTRSWQDSDFVSGRAPTVLDGVRVTVDGIPAYVAFISPGQINVQAPDGIRPGNVPVVVTSAAGASTPYVITAAARTPGLLAPASFAAGGKQYVAAIHSNLAFVGPANLVPGANFRPAVPGDVIVLYGVGFGATAPASLAGQPAPAGTLPNVVLQLGQVTVPLAYAGASPGAYGLYQFNFTVPAGLSGDVPLTLSVDGVVVNQTLWFAVR